MMYGKKTKMTAKKPSAKGNGLKKAAKKIKKKKMR